MWWMFGKLSIDSAKERKFIIFGKARFERSDTREFYGTREQIASELRKLFDVN